MLNWRNQVGYNTRPEMVTDNIDLLTRIKRAVELGEELKFKVKEEAMVSTEQYRLRRILAATDIHRSAYGGEFAGLGAAVSLKMDASRGTIIVTPRVGVRLEEYKASERDALDVLSEAKGSMAMVEFTPSEEFALDQFVRRAFELGWIIHTSTRTETEDGAVSFAAERRESADSSNVGFGVLGSTTSRDRKRG